MTANTPTPSAIAEEIKRLSTALGDIREERLTGGLIEANAVAALYAAIDRLVAMASSAQQGEPVRQDAERYRFLCAHPWWQFIEKLCLEFAADDSRSFKLGMDQAIDARRLAGATNWQMAIDQTQTAALQANDTTKGTK